METDSSSEDSLDDNTEKQDLQSIDDLERDLILQKESLQKKLEDMKIEMGKNRKLMAYYQDLLLDEEISQRVPSESECLGRIISPLGSLTYKSPNLSKDAFENLPDSTVLAGSLKDPDVISDDINGRFASSDILNQEINEASAKGSENISYISEISDTRIDTRINEFLAINSQSRNETQDTGSDLGIRLPGTSSKIGTSAESGGSYAGKGKEAANPKFRYKKTSKPGVSSCESVAVETPVKHSEKVFCIPDSKSLKPQSLKHEITRVSPAVKRKSSDSSEEDNDERQLEERCSRTFLFSKFRDNKDDDNLKMAKKLKFEDDEKASKQCPYISTLLLQKKNEKSCIDMSEFVDISQIDQSHNESEQLILPSSSGTSNIVPYISTSNESSPTDRSDVPLTEQGESSLKSVSEEVLLSELGVSSLTSVSEDVPFSEQGESSLTSVGEDIPLGEQGESSLMNVSEDVPLGEQGESSLMNVSEDVPLGEQGESSLNVSEIVAVREREETSFTRAKEDKTLSGEQTSQSMREDKSLRTIEETLPSSIEKS